MTPCAVMKKRKLAVSDKDDLIAELVRNAGHKTLAAWACDCAERALPYFENKHPRDDRPRLAVEAGREWVNTGVFKMADVRRVSLAAHAAAREVEDDDAARAAARAAGQALATAHVPTHAIATAIYAATTFRDSAEPADAETALEREREWQLQRLRDLAGITS
jgi:hypothetical protein